MNKRTPGPWRLTYSNCWIVGRDEQIGDVVVAEMKDGGLSDATLIASAPALLVALKDAADTMRIHCPDAWAYKQAMEAINKAEGAK